MKSLRLLFILFFFAGSLKAQKTNLTGRVIDTLNAPLIGATVMLLQAQDSVLSQFGTTDNEGQFTFKKLAPDSYVLQISYLGYANFNQPISIDNQTINLNLGDLLLRPESALLEAVEVKADFVPIRLKKDTIEYNAAAFQTKPNADVEALLKKLPGIEVDRNGGIKAQGESVQKVLVDGKEFFGNDPKIATKNLPADAVDKVQVFDKKSDIAEFSGIDDGREAKTINLSLKEDKKKGYFGKIKGGYGNEKRYENKFNINRFGSNVQFSTLGMFNNTNQQGFSINDYINMMGGLNNLLSGGSGELTFDSEDLGLPLDAGQRNQGFTQTSAGGLNLNWEINKKTKLHTSYFFNGLTRDYAIQENNQNLLGEQSFQSNRNAQSRRKNEGHRLNANLTSKIDSFQTVKWRTNLGFTRQNNSLNSFNQTFNLANQLENSGTQSVLREGDDLRWNTNLTYLRRFKKKGRFFTTNLAWEKQNQDQQKNLQAQNQFFQGFVAIDSLRQQHDRENLQTNYGLGLTYTEPLGKAKYLELSYSLQNYSNDLTRNVYDIQEMQLLFNANLSNHFQRDYLYQRTGLAFQWNAKKWSFNGGLNAQKSILQGVLLLNDLTIRREFFNWLPKARLEYDFKATRSLRLDYRTIVSEPSLEQLQPIVDNSDPLNLYVGNPELRPEYRHDFRLNFNSFDQFSSISIFASLRANFTRHKIVNSRVLDAQFRQTIQPFNFGEDSRLSGYLSFGAPLKFWQGRLNGTTDLERYKGNYIVNSIGNIYRTYRNSIDVNYTNKNTDLIEIAVGYKWVKNLVKYEGEGIQNQDFSRQIFYTDFAWNLTDNWTLSSTIDYSQYSDASFGNATEVTLWKAGLEYHFLKNKRGTLAFNVNDILNQNVGINRYGQLNFLQEQRIVSLGRYYLLSFQYALSGFGGQADMIKTVRRR